MAISYFLGKKGMSRNQVNKLYPVLYLLNTLYTLYMFYEFKGIKPVVHETAFVHPQAVVTGNVIIGKDCYIVMELSYMAPPLEKIVW